MPNKSLIYARACGIQQTQEKGTQSIMGYSWSAYMQICFRMRIVFRIKQSERNCFKVNLGFNLYMTTFLQLAVYMHAYHEYLRQLFESIDLLRWKKQDRFWSVMNIF